MSRDLTSDVTRRSLRPWLSPVLRSQGPRTGDNQESTVAACLEGCAVWRDRFPPTRQPTGVRCVRHDTARRQLASVTVVCLRSMWLCLRSITYLPATTHAQPQMRKPPERRRGERRDAGVTRHTAGASRASAHVPARGAPRPAAPRVASLTP